MRLRLTFSPLTVSPLLLSQAVMRLLPIQLHLEPSDLLVKSSLGGLILAVAGWLGAVGEDGLGPFEQLLLPGVDEGGVDAVLAGQLVDSFLALDGRQCHLGLERRRMPLPLPCHCVPPLGHLL
jgi:hypothetical protein